MKLSESKYFGLHKTTTEVFFDKSLRHLEVYEVTTILGFKIKEADYELFIPDISKEDVKNFKALAGVLLHLHNMGLKITEVYERGR